MHGIINFEYLISPVLSKKVSMLTLVSDLKLLSDLLEIGIVKFYLEEGIVIKMNEYGYFPSNRIFHHAISKLAENPSFSANDIVKYVNSILKTAEEYNPDHLLLWESYVFDTYKIKAFSDKRKNTLLEGYRDLAFLNLFKSRNCTPLYFHDEYMDTSITLTFNDVVSDSEPKISNSNITNSKFEIEVISNLKHFLYKLDGFDLYKSACTALQMKFALYVGALNLIHDNMLQTKLDWDDFTVGSSFVNSLMDNEASDEKQFSSVTYNTIINLLASSGKCEINYFYKSDDPDTPRTYGDYTAYRVHITKQNRGLRLLFWGDEHQIIIANIGNKNECVIINP